MCAVLASAEWGNIFNISADYVPESKQRGASAGPSLTNISLLCVILSGATSTGALGPADPGSPITGG